MTRPNVPVTTSHTPDGDPALDAAFDAAIIPLVEAIRTYAHNGPDDGPVPGIRLLDAENAFHTALAAALTGLHADMDDIHRGPNAMPYVERHHNLLLGQLLGHHLPALFAARMDVAALNGDTPWSAALDEQALIATWTETIAEQAIAADGGEE